MRWRRSAARSVRELKFVGEYTVSELREYGFVVTELRGIYTVKDMCEHGFSLDELREGGTPEHAVLAVDGRSPKELRAAGCTAKILRRIGFTLHELVERRIHGERAQARVLRRRGAQAGGLHGRGAARGQVHVEAAAGGALHATRDAGGRLLLEGSGDLPARDAWRAHQGGLQEPRPQARVLSALPPKEDEETGGEVVILSPRYPDMRYANDPMGFTWRAPIDPAEQLVNAQRQPGRGSRACGTRPSAVTAPDWRDVQPTRYRRGHLNCQRQGVARLVPNPPCQRQAACRGLDTFLPPPPAPPPAAPRRCRSRLRKMWRGIAG